MNEWISVKDRLPNIDLLVPVRHKQGDEELKLWSGEDGYIWRYNSGLFCCCLHTTDFWKILETR